MKPELSVVLPTKEEEAVFGTIERIRKNFGRSTEIIVVDKSTPQFHKRLQKTGAKVFWQKDRGVENAMIYGVRHTHGKIVVSLDADGTHDVSGIRDGTKIIREGKADMVLGNRMGNIEPGAMSGYLRFGNARLSNIYNVFLGQHVHDVLTGLLVMSRESVDAVKDIKNFEMPILFFQIEIAKKGFRVEEVPINYYKRKFGASRLTKSKFFYGFNTASKIIKRAASSN